MPGILSSFFYTGAGAPLSIEVGPTNPLDDYNPIPYGNSENTAFVTAAGGTPPYVYDATYVSGSTDIVGSDTTTASPDFNATGDGEPVNMKEAVWNFKVTDAALTEVNTQLTIRFFFGLEPP